MRTYVSGDTRVIEWLGKRDAEHLKLEIPLGLVHISKDLSDRAGRQVVAISVRPDQYAGEQVVIWDDGRLIQLLPGETRESWAASKVKEQAIEDANYGLLEATIEDQTNGIRETFTFKNTDQAEGFWMMFRWAKANAIDGHELNELNPGEDDEEDETV